MPEDQDKSSQKNYLDPIGRSIDLVTEAGRLVLMGGGALRVPFKASEKTGVIAIVGATHGHFSCALNWLAAWMLFSGRHLDLILQVGDLTDETVNCSPTSRKYRGLPSDFGLEDPRPESERLASLYQVNPDLATVPVVFIAGNHNSEAIAVMHERQCCDSDLSVSSQLLAHAEWHHADRLQFFRQSRDAIGAGAQKIKSGVGRDLLGLQCRHGGKV